MRTIFVAFLLLSAASAQTGALPRRGFFGAGFAAGEGGTVRIDAVFEGAAAAQAGLRTGDVVVRVAGVDVKQPGDVVSVLRGKRAGEVVPVEVRRGGEPVRLEVKLAPLPFEQGEGIEVEYGTVSVDGALRRTVVTRPRGGGGKAPAMLLIGGVGCYPVDSPMQTSGYREITHRLAREGFVTMRVEKSGMGDSQGAPCMTVDLDTELAGYREGLRALRALPYVDTDRVFLFGHSMGGLTAPLLGKDVPVRGIAVMATVGNSWFEYELANTRRQQTLSGESEAEVDRWVRLRARCVTAMLIEKKETPAECSEVQYPASLAYMRQVAAIPLGEAWAATSAPVLVMYGMADFVSGEADHRYLVDRLNRMKAGRATLMLIDGLDHFFLRAQTQSESMRAPQNARDLHMDWLPRLTEWMRARG